MRKSLTFVNHDDNFKYRNNTPDMHFLEGDGLHLAAPDISKLLVNLGLNEHVVCSFVSGPRYRWQHSTQRAMASQPMPSHVAPPPPIPHPHYQSPTATRPKPQHTQPPPPICQPQQTTSRSTHQQGNQRLTAHPIWILFK